MANYEPRPDAMIRAPMVVLLIALAVVLVAVVVVVLRGRRHSETIESRVEAPGHVGVIAANGAEAGLECDVCGEVFPTSEELEEHVAQYHRRA